MRVTRVLQALLERKVLREMLVTQVLRAHRVPLDRKALLVLVISMMRHRLVTSRLVRVVRRLILGRGTTILLVKM